MGDTIAPILILCVTAAFGMTVLLTYLGIRLLPQLGLVDEPRGRHLHKQPTPSGGGFAIVLAFFLTAQLYYLTLKMLDLSHIIPEYWIKITGPLLFISISGFIDDRWEMKSYVKLIAQIITAVWAWSLGLGISGMMSYPFPGWLSLIATVFWFVALINAFNLIDGLDGLAAGLAVIAALSLAVFFYFLGNLPYAQLLLIFAGCCCGFLVFNFPPARIFMGDCGSMFIGTFFAINSAACYSKSSTLISLFVPLLALSVPLFDVALAVWRRSVRKYFPEHSGSRVMTGDHLHLHHRILGLFQGNQKLTVLSIYLMALTISGAGLLLSLIEELRPAVWLIDLTILVLLGLRLSFVEVIDSIHLLSRQLGRSSRKGVIIAIHPVLDFLMFVFSLFFTVWCFNLPFFQGLIVVLYLPCGLVFALFGIYRTFWLRAGFRSYYLQCYSLLISSVIGIIIITLVNYFYIHPRIHESRLALAFTFFTLLFAALIMTERLGLRYVEYYALRYYRSKYWNFSGSRTPERVLIYGGGVMCQLYLTAMFSGYSPKTSLIVGIMDDVPVLRNMFIHGYPVLGSIHDLEEIFKKHAFERIIITFEELNLRQKSILKEFSRKHGIPVNSCGLVLKDFSGQNCVNLEGTN